MVKGLRCGTQIKIAMDITLDYWRWNDLVLWWRQTPRCHKQSSVEKLLRITFSKIRCVIREYGEQFARSTSVRTRPKSFAGFLCFNSTTFLMMMLSYASFSNFISNTRLGCLDMKGMQHLIQLGMKLDNEKDLGQYGSHWRKKASVIQLNCQRCHQFVLRGAYLPCD